jgi:hypothetical protein
MAGVRGTNFLDAQAFVREGHGPDAHDRVLAALDPEALEVLGKPIKEEAWYPVEALLAYLVAARRVLEPEAGDFYRRQGFFAARRRKEGPLRVMVETPERRMRLAATAWRTFYDIGHLEVVGASVQEATARIHGFPATPELCERFLGIWEGLSSEPGRRARAEEIHCVRRGDPYCELSVSYDPEAP